MPNSQLLAGALSQILIHDETGCPHSARHATLLLERLCDAENLDDEMRALCERASRRFASLASAHEGGKRARAA